MTMNKITIICALIFITTASIGYYIGHFEFETEPINPPCDNMNYYNSGLSKGFDEGFSSGYDYGVGQAIAFFNETLTENTTWYAKQGYNSVAVNPYKQVKK